MAKVNDL